jgi:hypothetical protein
MKTRSEIEKRLREQELRCHDGINGLIVQAVVMTLEWVLSDDPDPSAEEVRAINENANTD